MAKAQRICSIDGCNKPAKGRGWCVAHYLRWKRNGDPLGIRFHPHLSSAARAQHFIHEVALSYDGDDCLIWPFSRNPAGRGQIYAGNKSLKAHRVVCELAHGTPPTPEHHAAHSCGNGHLGCVNPKHLRWATPVENEADKLIHGTHNRGERHGNAKLTAEDVLRIRASKWGDQRRLAKELGVNWQTIGEVRRGKSWAWLK